MINANLDVRQIATLCPDLWDGMHSPTVATLAGGQIYKFTRASLPSARQIASPWWFTEAEFQKVRNYLRLDPGNVGSLARTQAAVKYEWSDMDMLVTATVLEPIRVFMGPGKWQVESTAAGSTVVFQAPQDLRQMYIPGIVDRATRALNASGTRALGNFRYQPVPSGDAIDQAILALQGKTVVIYGNPVLH